MQNLNYKFQAAPFINKSKIHERFCMFSLRATLILLEYFQVSEKYIPTIAGGNELTKQVTA